MNKPRYLNTQSTAKIGINYIKKIVKTLKHKFISIHQEDDIGLDCFVQMMNNGIPTKLISIQVKSGDSFFDFKNQKCIIQVKNHSEYWKENDFPVFGIVYIPSLYRAFWCDIKASLNETDQIKVIKFSANDESEFNHITFMEFTTNLGYSPIHYIEKINYALSEDNVLSHFLNLVVKDISGNIKHLVNFSNFRKFLFEIDFRLYMEYCG